MIKRLQKRGNSHALVLDKSMMGHHGFVDGNKRVGTLAALIFLEVNGIEQYPDAADLENVAFAVARGELDKPGLTDWWRTQTESRTS